MFIAAREIPSLCLLVTALIITRCSLGIGNRRILCLLSRILWLNVISIYTLSDLGDLSNLIGSLSRTIQQYSPHTS